MEDTVDIVNGVSCVVGREVSKQPPWSMATSTITEPGSISRSMSRVTSFGALAPGISTEPITRSACLSSSRILYSEDIRVLTFLGITSAR